MDKQALRIKRLAIIVAFLSCIIIFFGTNICFADSVEKPQLRITVPKFENSVLVNGIVLKLEWDNDDNAKSYFIRWKKKGEKSYDWLNQIYTSENEYRISEPDSNTVYKISIQAVGKDGKRSAWDTHYFKTPQAASKIKPPKKIILKKRPHSKHYKNYNIKWKRVKGASGYDLQVKQLIKYYGKKRWMVTGGVSASEYFYGDTSKIKYYEEPVFLSKYCIKAKYRIRTSDGNGCGKWSKWKKIPVSKKIKGYYDGTFYGEEYQWIRSH